VRALFGVASESTFPILAEEIAAVPLDLSSQPLLPLLCQFPGLAHGHKLFWGLKGPPAQILPLVPRVRMTSLQVSASYLPANPFSTEIACSHSASVL
jgi:hypothetical protein